MRGWYLALFLPERSGAVEEEPALGGRMKDCFDGQSFFRCGGAGGLLY